GADDGVTGDFLFDLDGHDAIPDCCACYVGRVADGTCCDGVRRRARPSSQTLSRFAGEGLLEHHFFFAALRTAFLAPAFFAGAFFAGAFFAGAFFAATLRLTVAFFAEALRAT